MCRTIPSGMLKTLLGAIPGFVPSAIAHLARWLRGFPGRRLNRRIREIRGNPTTGLLLFGVLRVFHGYSPLSSGCGSPRCVLPSLRFNRSNLLLFRVIRVARHVGQLLCCSGLSVVQNPSFPARPPCENYFNYL